jgi:hypothetical protein
MQGGCCRKWQCVGCKSDLRWGSVVDVRFEGLAQYMVGMEASSYSCPVGCL